MEPFCSGTEINVDDVILRYVIGISRDDYVIPERSNDKNDNDALLISDEGRMYNLYILLYGGRSNDLWPEDKTGT